jgi:hypothetical protein
MEHNRERGEGRFGTVVALLVIAAAGYCAWNAGPPYLANWELKDKLVEVARMPRGTNTDDKLLDVLERYLREEQLSPYINRSNFRINTRETARTVSLSYERRVKFLPGVERMVRFEQTVEQPLLF